MRARAFRVAVAASVGVSGVSLSQGAIISRTVALSGGQVPGSSATVPGETFASFSGPYLNASGSVVAVGSVTGTGVVSASGNTQNSSVLISEGSGSLALIGQEGFLAPTAAGGGTGTNWAGTWLAFNSAPQVMDASGHVFILGSLKLGTNGGVAGSDGTVVNSTNTAGFWSERSGSLSLLLRTGDTLTTGVTAKGLSNLLVTPTGKIGFSLTTSDNLGGVMSEESGSLAYVAKGGGTAPGTGGATYLTGGTFSAPTMNASGQMAFRASLTTGSGSPAVTATTNQGIWTESGGSLHLVARAGSQAPGVATGDVFGTSFTPPVFNNAGQTAFANTLVVGGDITSTNNGGMWSEGGGTLHLVAQKGTQAPGTPTGAVFNSFSNPVIDHAGQIAFQASLQTTGGGVTSANSSGIWTEGPGLLTLLARTGSQAPGTAAGDLFNFLGSTVSINGLGEVAFTGTMLTGTGDVTSSNNSGIWAQDPSGVLQLVLRTGQSFQVAPGDVRTVQGYSFNLGSGNEDGRAMTWNDSETMAVYMTFTNGTNGIFTLSVPEPGMIGLTVLPAALMLRRRRMTVIAGL